MDLRDELIAHSDRDYADTRLFEKKLRIKKDSNEFDALVERNVCLIRPPKADIGRPYV